MSGADSGCEVADGVLAEVGLEHERVRPRSAAHDIVACGALDLVGTGGAIGCEVGHGPDVARLVLVDGAEGMDGGGGQLPCREAPPALRVGRCRAEPDRAVEN